MSYTIDPFNELYHHGILGQKWGIRRYQNEDGTLTPAGRERYGKSIERGEKKLSKGESRGTTIAKGIGKAALIAGAAAAGVAVVNQMMGQSNALPNRLDEDYSLFIQNLADGVRRGDSGKKLLSDALYTDSKRLQKYKNATTAILASSGALGAAAIGKSIRDYTDIKRAEKARNGKKS